MKSIIRICGILLIVNIIISCSNDKNNSNTDENNSNTNQITAIDNSDKKEPLFASVAEKFEFNNEDSYLNITSLILSNQINCPAEEKLCPEILEFIGGNKLVFVSNESEELSANINFPDYEIVKTGEIKIGNNEYPANLYYNGGVSESRVEFHGVLILREVPIELLPGGELIIFTKGNQ